MAGGGGGAQCNGRGRSKHLKCVFIFVHFDEPLPQPYSSLCNLNSPAPPLTSLPFHFLQPLAPLISPPTILILPLPLAPPLHPPSMQSLPSLHPVRHYPHLCWWRWDGGEEWPLRSWCPWTLHSKMDTREHV